MRGGQSKDDLQFDPEIERTARANRKVFRLTWELESKMLESYPELFA